MTCKTAWFMAQRIREAMREGNDGLPGSGSGAVEADETFPRNARSEKHPKAKKARGYEHKEKILSLVERGGRIRSFHVAAINMRPTVAI